MFLMRVLGTFLCFFPILSVLVEQQRSPWLMGLLAANAFIWPTIAFWRVDLPRPYVQNIKTWCWTPGQAVSGSP